MLTQQQITAFRQKALAKGFSESQIAQEIARKNQEITRTAVTQPTQPVQSTPNTTKVTAPMSTPPVKANKSLGGLAKNAVQDVVDFAVNTPINTVKQAGGLGFEVGRATDIKSTKKKSDKIQAQMNSLVKKMKAEKDPAKLEELRKQTRALSDQLIENSKGFTKAAKAENKFIDVKEVGTVGELGKGILRNIGNSVGLTTDEKGNVVFDLQLAIDSAYEKPVTTALLAKDITKGGTNLYKKTTGKEAVVATTKKAGSLKKVGSNLREDVLNPKVKADPFYSKNVESMRKIQDELGLKGGSRVQLDQIGEYFNKTQNKIKSELKKGAKPKTGILKREFTKELDNANYVIDDPQFAKAVQIEQKVIDSLRGKSGADLYEQMGKYRRLLKSTYKKIDKGTTLLPKEEARIAAFNALKSTIDTVSPEIRDLNTLQHQMYEISEGLGKSAQKKIGPAGLLTQPVQSAIDVTGRALQGADKFGKNISSKIPNVSIPGGTGVKVAGAGALQIKDQSSQIEQPQDTEQSNLNGDVNQDYTDEQFNQSEDSVAHPIFGNATKQKVLEDAFRKGLNGKQLDEIENLYDRFAPQGTGTIDETTQKAASSLRQEYLQQTKGNGYMDVVNAYRKVASAPSTAAGDVSLVFAYMKMLDPGSTVREGEYATAENTAGIPEKIVNSYNKALTGKRLGAKQVAEFKDAAKTLFDQSSQVQEQIDGIYTKLAQKYGVDPELLGIGIIGID